MSPNESGMDRLLTRHKIDVDIHITWDVRAARKLLGRSKETSSTARLLNLSLEGALVEVALPSDRKPGDIVTIEMGAGRRGTVEIRHAHVEKSGDRVLYGIKFVESSALTAVINHIIADARGSNDKLRRAWESAR